MLAIDRILFPTDGSPCAEHARAHAQFLAQKHAATLHVLHVEERPADWTDVIDVKTADVLADLHRIDAAWDDDAPTAVPDARTVQHTLAHPSASDGILAYAAEHDVDLVVMGTHGRRGVERVVMGSVAESVLRRSGAPVLAVRAPDPSAASAAHASEGLDGIARLLVPVDLSDRTPGLLAHAREIALAYAARIDLLYVVEPVALPPAYGTGTEPLGVDLDALVAEARPRLDALARALDAQGVDAEAHVRRGRAETQILDAATDVGADLLVIATHGRSGVPRFVLGSVAESVLRRAPCPVFAVKSFGKALAHDVGDTFQQALVADRLGRVE